MLDELKKLDTTFQEALFYSKVNNIFVLMLNAIMLSDMTGIESSLSSNMKEKISKQINELIKNNEIQMYDELNVKSTTITNVNITDDMFFIDVKLVSRYLDYKLDRNTKEYKYGDKESRIEIVNYLTFCEKRNHRDMSKAFYCPNCGANVDYNYSGLCKYCNSQLPKEEYDWILESWRLK